MFRGFKKAFWKEFGQTEQYFKNTKLQGYKITKLQENNLEKFKINTGL